MLEPLTPESPGAKGLEKQRRPRLHSRTSAFRVKNAQAAFDYMKDAGFSIIDTAPRKGSRGTTVFFVHPKSRPDTPFGVLLEVVEDPSEA